jgi:chemotaxis protein methyltransferase CheR
VETGSIRDSEINLLLSDFSQGYGYDFTGYSEASLKRRIERVYMLDKSPSFAEFRYKIKNNPDYFSHIVDELTVNVTEMLRDPPFYKTIKEKILPALSTYPLIRIWHAGCSTGEEVYSMAILLKEANLLHKSLLYATDISSRVIDKARMGIFPLSQMQKYSENYILSGGARDFSSYYTANYNMAKFDESLGRKMIFATHNLVSDFSFNQFQFILCRNVLIYFNKDLQAKVLSLFDASLENLGFLALGTKESLRFSNLASKYIEVHKEDRIWRKHK